ncbi:MAG: SpoIVB peptidase [Chloroflexota bacterium]
MKNDQRRRQFGLLVVAFILIICATPQFRNICNFPSELRLSEGQVELLEIGLPLPISVRLDSGGVISLNGQAAQNRVTNTSLARPLAIESASPGTVNLQIRLFGIIPIRRIAVNVIPEVKVIPAGHSIGILLRSNGVMVVGLTEVVDDDGKSHQPARDAGIAVGDLVTAINGMPVGDDDTVARIIDDCGRRGVLVECEVHRGNQVFTCSLPPILCHETGRYRVGMYIRDGAAGVGTLTYYDPATKRYGALGHVITDADTGRPIPIGDGRIVSASVCGIEQGRRGQPGEKIGSFVQESDTLGNIERNTDYGIIGTMNTAPASPFFSEPIPAVLASQVTEGPAEIITVVEGQKLERYGIEIVKVVRQGRPDTKGMVIKVTDPRLLSKTGGIVQGMSGSPIIQNGRLVGAVTHVFVNDPTRGYAVFVEWMLREAGIIGDSAKPVGLLPTGFGSAAGSHTEKIVVSRQMVLPMGYTS